MGKMKELLIEEERQYRTTVIGEFRFDDSSKAEGFRKRFLDFLQRERSIYIFEQDLDVTICSKEFVKNYGNLVEILKNRTFTRV